jgi:PhnB protein
MPESVRPIPEGFHTLTPHIVVKGASAAIEFYARAFGAEVLGSQRLPDGTIMHATLRIGDSMLMLNDEFPQWGVVGPQTLQGTPVTIHMYCEDLEAAWSRALGAGCAVGMPLQDTFWGARYGMLLDPFGHHWSLAQHVRDMTPEEIQRGAAKAMGGDEPGF